LLNVLSSWNPIHFLPPVLLCYLFSLFILCLPFWCIRNGKLAKFVCLSLCLCAHKQLKHHRTGFAYNFVLARGSKICRKAPHVVNLLKPTGHVMHQQFNIQQLSVLPTLYLCVVYLRTNSDLCQLQHKLIGFYNRDEKCLQRGTDWVFK
jgi:hypothetical protein